MHTPLVTAPMLQVSEAEAVLAKGLPRLKAVMASSMLQHMPLHTQPRLPLTRCCQ